MTTLDEMEIAVRELRTMQAPDGLAGGMLPPRLKKAASPRVGSTRTWLANSVLAHLPLAVAVIDTNSRLLFWNEQAAWLFGVPSLVATEKPDLCAILAKTRGLTQRHCDEIVAFGAVHIAAGDRAESDSCLRLSLARGQRIAIQVQGLGAGRWMLVIHDGKIGSASNPRTQGAGDAWLDALTGLSNRRHFDQVLGDIPGNATSETRHAVLLIDLDRFAPVNDTLGWPVGDALLCLVAQRLRRETRDQDLLVRLGGDEFAILIPNGDISNGDCAEALAARVIESLSGPFLVEGHLVTIGASIGIARFPDHGTSGDALMHHADLALHEAKAAGRGTWRRFDAAMAIKTLTRQEPQADPGKALTLGELSSQAFLPSGSGELSRQNAIAPDRLAAA